MHTSRTTRRVLAALAAVGISITAAAPSAQACEGCPISVFTTVTTQNSIQVNGTYQPLVGNFAGDPAEDIFWYAPGSAPDSLWVADSTARGVFEKIPMRVNGTYVPVVGDFTGDPYDDILWYGPGTVPDSLWTSVPGSAVFSSRPQPVNGFYEPLAISNSLPDLSSPGAAALSTEIGATRAGPSTPKSSIVWYRPGPATDFLWVFRADGGYDGVTIDIPGAPKLYAMNANDDTFEDFLAYSPGSGPDAIFRNDTGAFPRTDITVNGTYSPVIVGSGHRDGILWVRPGPASDFYWRGNSSGIPSPAATGQVVAAGPSVGLGTATAYLYDPNGIDQVFVDGAVVDSSTQDVGPGAVPLRGDFDNDKKIDIFFYRPGPGRDLLGFGA